MNNLIDGVVKIFRLKWNIMVHTPEESTGVPISTVSHVITGIRFLTESAFILRFTRGNLQFRAGQRIIVGLKGDMDQRDYSIYSGENDDYLEILVKEIIGGNVSVRLKNCLPGQSLNVNGPFGSFCVEDSDRRSRKLFFIATGTGISPFHSLVRSYPGIDYTLLHGVQFGNEAYESDQYEAGRYLLCTSREKNEHKRGRVTKFLPHLSLAPDMLFYLCGNGSMIYDVFHILRNRGIPAENIFSEIYFE